MGFIYVAGATEVKVSSEEEVGVSIGVMKKICGTIGDVSFNTIMLFIYHYEFNTYANFHLIQSFSRSLAS